MINKLLEKELKGIYDFEFKENALFIYPYNDRYNPIYKITDSGIGGYERGSLVYIDNFGSLDNNILAFTIKQGKSSLEYNNKIKELRDEIKQQKQNHSPEEVIKNLGLDKIVENYISNHNDITLEPYNTTHVTVNLNKENLTGTIAVDKLNTTKLYIDIINLIMQNQYVEKLLSENMLDIKPDLFIQLVSYSATGLSTKVKDIQNVDNYTK